MSDVKNLYIKSWFLSEDEVEAALAEIQLQWKRIDSQFMFAVTPDTYDSVLQAIGPLNSRNGSMIHESQIDFVNASPEEVAEQFKALYGGLFI